MRVFLSVVSLLLVAGCAAPHRTSSTLHERKNYQGRIDGLVAVETWTDTEKGGGVFLFTTSDVRTLSAVHTNQTALGGGSVFKMGQAHMAVDPQTAAIMEALGKAIGILLGEALKTAATP